MQFLRIKIGLAIGKVPLAGPRAPPLVSKPVRTSDSEWEGAFFHPRICCNFPISSCSLFHEKNALAITSTLGFRAGFREGYNISAGCYACEILCELLLDPHTAGVKSQVLDTEVYSPIPGFAYVYKK